MDSSTESLVNSSADMAKPEPLDMSHHFSETTKHRFPSKMKEYYKFFQIPGIGNLAGGLPNVQFFPYDTLEAQIAKPERWTPSPDQPEDGDAVLVSRAGTLKLSESSDPTAPVHLTVPKATSESDPLKKIDLASALQYGLSQGYPPLLSWVRQFSRDCLHPNVPYKGGVDVMLTVGSTDGFAKTLELFVDPWSPEVHDVEDRPGMLVETFVYGNVLSQVAPKGVQIVPVEADAGGMRVTGPGGLEDVLANWDPSTGKRPSLMYTVTMGHNPTGILLSIERRKAIYAACSKYDVIIVEDDPYWYLQFPSAAVAEAASRNQPAPAPAPVPTPAQSSGYPFLDGLVPSFLSVDTDGRVVRLDTFSKTVAPGCRLGWITAQPALVERYVRIAETSTQQPSGFVQSLISELVLGPDQPADARSAFAALRSPRDRAAFAGWHMAGWVRWLAGLRGAYERRMNRMCTQLDEGSFQLKQGTPVRAADAELCVVTKTPLFSFAWPRAGMFVWLRMNFPAHPLWRAVGSHGAVLDGTVLSAALMMYLTREPFRVLVAPGSMFSATDEIRTAVGWEYYRLCFAAETEENVDACSERFVAGVQRFWKIKKVKELEDLIKDLPTAAEMDRVHGGDMEGGWLGC